LFFTFTSSHCFFSLLSLSFLRVKENKNGFHAPLRSHSFFQSFDFLSFFFLNTTEQKNEMKESIFFSFFFLFVFFGQCVRAVLFL